MAHLHQVLGKAREHQARIADDREQHFSHGFGLLRIKSLSCGPVARQSELAQILQLRGRACGGRGHQCVRVSPRSNRRVAQRRSNEDGMGKIFGLGQRTDDLRCFSAEDDGCWRTFSCNFDRRGGARDGLADRRRTGQYSFHNDVALDKAASCGVSRAANCRYDSVLSSRRRRRRELFRPPDTKGMVRAARQ